MTIEQRGPHWRAMRDHWDLDAALMAGSAGMRAARERYLPRYERETEANYQRRLTVGALTNFYAKAVASMVGEIFREPAVVADSAIDEAVLADIDLRGSSVSAVCARLAGELLRRNCAAIVVDYPRTDGAETLADVRRLGLRHYWTVVEAPQIIAAHEELVGGARRLTHLRWFERVAERSGEFGLESHDDICVLDAAGGQPRARRYRAGAAGLYAPLTEWMPLAGDRIPAVVAQSNRTALLEGAPPLAGIAEKNAQHWRQSSNLGNVLEAGAFPMLARFGWRDDPSTEQSTQTLVGPHVVIDMPPATSGADVRYVEPSGASYAALERALDRIVAEAEMMALDLLIKRPSRTATEATYDRLQQLAPLQLIAQEVERAAGEALTILATLRALNETPGRVAIDRDFGVTANDALRIQALRDARAIGDITAATYLNELKAVGALSATLDPALEAERAAAQMTDADRQ